MDTNIDHFNPLVLREWVNYRIAGIFRGVKILKMFGFVVIHGKKIVVGSDLNHTPHARVELWPILSK